MKIVADTNIFLTVVLDEPEKPEIIRLTAGCELVAPPILPFELGNALSSLLKRGVLTSNGAISAWDALQAIPVELRSIDIREAIKTAARFNIYAYDAYVLECAISLRIPLITLDRRMKSIAQDLSIQVLELTQ